MALHDRIRARREALGLSQDQLAEAAKLSRTGVSNLECGLNRPHVDTLLRLEAALGLEAGGLLREDDIVCYEPAKRPDTVPPTEPDAMCPRCGQALTWSRPNLEWLCRACEEA
jgi:transcriptional regulator with XRE-family HTH domain